MAVAIVLVHNWWALALRGGLAVLFGVAAFAMPGLTLAFLIALFGAYAVIDGVLAIVAGVKAAERHERFGSLLWRGILGIAAGLLAFILPAATAVVLTLIIGVWAIVTGVLEIVAAVHLRRASLHRFQRQTTSSQSASKFQQRIFPGNQVVVAKCHEENDMKLRNISAAMVASGISAAVIAVSHKVLWMIAR